MTTDPAIETAQREWLASFLASGHIPVRDEDGQPNFFGWEAHGHNGLRCAVCDQGQCVWCRSPIEPCAGDALKIARQAEEAKERAGPELFAALSSVEFVTNDGEPFCPSCWQWKSNGHKSDCKLALALANVVTPTPTPKG